MKPLGVLLLVIVAVVGLFFAINQLGGDSGEGEGTVPGLVVDSGEEPDPAGGTSTALTDPDRGTREAVEGTTPVMDREEANPTGGEQYENTVSGLILGADQRPVANAMVTLTRAGLTGQIFVNESLDRSQDIHALTNDQGKYIFANVEPYDQYSVEANAEGYARSEMPGVVVDAIGDVNLPPIVLGVGASLSGVVLDTAGNPVPDATMRLDSMFMATGGDASPDAIETTTNSDGTYLFGNVPAGNRTLSIGAEGYANLTKGGLVFRGEEPLTLTLTLEVAEMICGKVISKAGTPVAGAKVLGMSFSNASKNCRDDTLTDENGEFCLSRVAPGQYTIAVTAQGFRAGHENRVKPGGAGLVIELVEQGLVSGRVLANGEAPIGPYTVQLRQTHPGQKITSRIGKPVTLTNTDGSFSIECTQSGTFMIEGRATGFAPTFSDEFRFTQGQPMNNVIVRLTNGGSITGNIVDPDGKPVPRPRITTHANDWTNSLFDRALGDQFPTNVTQKATTGNGAGRFELENLTAETYQIRVRAPGFCEATMKDVFVTEGKDTNVGQVQLIRGGEITGTVIDLAGQPVVGATVSLNPDGRRGDELPRSYTAQAGADGKYVLRNVWPGKYKLSATRGGGGGGDIFDAFATDQNSIQQVSVQDGGTQHFELKIAQ